MAGNTFALQTHINNILQPRLDKEVAAIKFANREFDGILKGKGSAVTVEDLPLVTLNDISDLGADQTPEVVSATPYTITVTQAKGIAIRVREIEQIRAAFDLGGSLVDNLVTANAIEMETHFLSTVNAGVAAGNRLYEGAPVPLTVANVIQYLDEMIVTLEDQNVDVSKVKIFMPNAVAGLIRQSDLYRNTERGVGAVEK